MRGDHLLHLVRHTRHRVHDRLADGAREPGRGAHRIVQDRRAAWHVGLAEVVVGHVAAPAAEQRRDVLHEVVATLEVDAHHRGQRLARHVVGRGPEPAAEDQGVGAVHEVLDRGHHASQVVAHLAVLVTLDARRRELLADPGTVGVDDLAEQQLGADRQDLTPHASPANRCGECRTPRPT